MGRLGQGGYRLGILGFGMVKCRQSQFILVHGGRFFLHKALQSQFNLHSRTPLSLRPLPGNLELYTEN